MSVSETERLQRAFAALLRGDLAERDRQLREIYRDRARAAERRKAKPAADAIRLEKQPDGTYAPASPQTTGRKS